MESKAILWREQVAPGCRIVMVHAGLLGPSGRFLHLKMVLDTGTPVTIIAAGLARKTGLTEERATGKSRLMGPAGPQDGYRLVAAQFAVRNRTLVDFEIHCHDLAPRLHVEGVLGLDILRRGELQLNLPGGLVEFRWA